MEGDGETHDAATDRGWIRPWDPSAAGSVEEEVWPGRPSRRAARLRGRGGGTRLSPVWAEV